jgi:hypothetical protein
MLSTQQVVTSPSESIVISREKCSHKTVSAFFVAGTVSMLAFIGADLFISASLLFKPRLIRWLLVVDEGVGAPARLASRPDPGRAMVN